MDDGATVWKLAPRGDARVFDLAMPVAATRGPGWSASDVVDDATMLEFEEDMATDAARAVAEKRRIQTLVDATATDESMLFYEEGRELVE
jgi:hypothetical protein